jgi:hypothetical protein
MTAGCDLTAICTCGQVAIQTVGKPILSAACYCDSCRAAARQFEQAPGAPAVVDQEGGVDYSLFRKDRVTLLRGGDHLQEHRLTPASPTRRVVASCCQAPMFVDYTRGHWLTLYRDRLHGAAPPLEAGIMARDFAPDHTRADGVPVYASHPVSFVFKLLAAWAAMRFQRPKIVW